MIVVMEPDASDQAVENAISFLVNAGFDVHRSSGTTTTILGVVGDLTKNDVSVVSEFPGVSQVVRVSEQFRLASRRFRQQSTVIEGPWGSIGGDKPWIALEAGGEYPNGARTLEIAAIARAKQRTHLPIVVDVPTIAQRSRYVESVACAAIAAGADGVILRTWIGAAGEVPRVPATLSWRDAVA